MTLVSNSRKQGFTRVLAFAVLVAMAAWVPHTDLGYPSWLVALRYAAYCAAGVSLIWMGAQGKSAVGLVARSHVLLFLALLMSFWVLSALWSDDWVFTLQKSLLALLTAAAVVSTANDMSSKRIMSTILLVVLTIVIGGALVAITFPEIGVDQSDFHFGKWKGISSQKNAFGMLAASAALLLLAPREMLPKRLGPATVRAFLISVCAICIFMSGSRGAMANALIGAGAVCFFRSQSSVQRAVVGVVVAALPLIACLILVSFRVEGDSLAFFGLDFETTGRIAIWRFAFDDMRGHELLGLGFGGFWVDSRITAFESIYGWVLPNFHNGYISLIVETGLIGGMLFCVFLAALVWTLLRNLGRVKSHGMWSFSATIVVFASQNIYENSLTRSTDFFFVLFLLSVSLVARMSCRSKEGSGIQAVRGFPVAHGGQI